MGYWHINGLTRLPTESFVPLAVLLVLLFKLLGKVLLLLPTAPLLLVLVLLFLVLGLLPLLLPMLVLVVVIDKDAIRCSELMLLVNSGV